MRCAVGLETWNSGRCRNSILKCVQNSLYMAAIYSNFLAVSKHTRNTNAHCFVYCSKSARESLKTSCNSKSQFVQQRESQYKRTESEQHQEWNHSRHQQWSNKRRV